MQNEGGTQNTQGTAAENGAVNADVVNITQGSAQNVRAKQVTLRQGGIQTAQTDHLEIRQGGVMTAKTSQLEMVQGGVGVIQTHSAHLTASNAGAILAGGDVKMEQSGARILVAKGEVTVDQGGSMLTIAQTVRMQNSGTIFLIANHVEGDVKPVFGQRESLLFGAVAGMVAGAMIMISNMVRRRRRG